MVQPERSLSISRLVLRKGRRVELVGAADAAAARPSRVRTHVQEMEPASRLDLPRVPFRV